MFLNVLYLHFFSQVCQVLISGVAVHVVFFFSIKATFSQILDVNELRWMEVNSTAAAAATFLTFYLQIVGLPSNLKGQSHLGKHLTLPHVFILFQPGAAQKAVTQQSGEVYGRQIWILLLC